MSKKNEKILYAGIECVVDGKVVHCTLAWLNNPIDMPFLYHNYFENYPFGKTVELHLIRKGANSTHSGYQVELPDSIVPWFTLRIPHITMSVADDCKAVDTWKVFATAGNCTDCDITVIGTVGYWTNKRGFQTKPL